MRTATSNNDNRNRGGWVPTHIAETVIDVIAACLIAAVIAALVGFSIPVLSGAVALVCIATGRRIRIVALCESSVSCWYRHRESIRARRDEAARKAALGCGSSIYHSTYWNQPLPAHLHARGELREWPARKEQLRGLYPGCRAEVEGCFSEAEDNALWSHAVAPEYLVRHALSLIGWYRKLCKGIAFGAPLARRRWSPSGIAVDCFGDGVQFLQEWIEKDSPDLAMLISLAEAYDRIEAEIRREIE